MHTSLISRPGESRRSSSIKCFLAMAEDRHASKSKTLLAADITLIFLSAVGVALRLLSRNLSRAALWDDDYAIIVAMPLAWMLSVLNLIGRSTLSF